MGREFGSVGGRFSLPPGPTSQDRSVRPAAAPPPLQVVGMCLDGSVVPYMLSAGALCGAPGAGLPAATAPCCRPSCWLATATDDSDCLPALALPSSPHTLTAAPAVCSLCCDGSGDGCHTWRRVLGGDRGGALDGGAGVRVCVEWGSICFGDDSWTPGFSA